MAKLFYACATNKQLTPSSLNFIHPYSTHRNRHYPGKSQILKVFQSRHIRAHRFSNHLVLFRYRHELCFFNGKLIVLGGGTSFESNGFEELAAFDVNKRKWASLKTNPDASIPVSESLREQYPEPRRCHSCVQTGQCKSKGIRISRPLAYQSYQISARITLGLLNSEAYLMYSTNYRITINL